MKGRGSDEGISVWQEKEKTHEEEKIRRLAGEPSKKRAKSL